MNARILLALSLLPAFAADKAPMMETAKVLAQEIASHEAGVYVAPLGRATVAVPINRESNYVAVDTGTEVMEWMEATRTLIVLPVNGRIEFYREKNWFIVLDPRGKKHKFSLVSLRVKEGK